MGHRAANDEKVVNGWWNNLLENQRETLIKKFFPNQLKKNSDANKFFNNLQWTKQLWLYEHVYRNYWDEYIKEKK